ncbi:MULTISPECIES: McrB family protein [unclassified Chryseobacterium]|uniref:McrB family protein n=1 Tax=unclassified Chryseobacterium TaxID=2593645 RepID=UPI001E4DAEAA|nr:MULTISPECIES: AAA family ATPase [unclassified Chryseobacterium]
MKSRNYWVISPNVKNNEEEDRWKEFISNNPYSFIGWDEGNQFGNTFINVIKKGDVIINAQRKKWIPHIFGIGIVSNDKCEWQEIENTPSGAYCRYLNPYLTKERVFNLNFDFKGTAYYGDNKQIPALYQLHPHKNENDKRLVETINKELEMTIKQQNIQNFVDLLKTNKNIILTGAPGTGKTFLAKQIAMQMVGVKTDVELEESGQFNFVQFHPSYDYTDFVEGLRPTSPDENGIIGFEIKTGIFKSFCDKAAENLVDSEKTPDEIQSESNIESILDNFLADSIQNGKKFDYNNNSNQFVIVQHSKKDDCFYAKILNNESMERQLVFKKDVIEVLKKADDVKKPTDIQRVFNTRFKYQYTFIFLILEQLRDKLKQKVEEPRIEIMKKDFIFVIDEINRGEISKIFGELFFSIDPGYRGKKGAVKTQYSNLHNNEYEVFYVPENVYIIGSMNDIDRSVESFDFAMRRRFTWIEVTAEQSAENMNLPLDIKERMMKLNNQISNTDGLNSSYHIGAAYFLDSDGKVREDIENIWKLRIEPLLKEYLRGVPDIIEKFLLLKNAFLA